MPTRVWHHAHVREGATLGSDCIVGQNAYIDVDVRVGDRVKIENNASVYRGAEIGDGAFIGPHAVLANDRHPRAVTPEGRMKEAEDWRVDPIRVRARASVGAGAIVLPGVTIGEHALVAAGAVVTRNVPAFGLVRGNPARLSGTACCCGETGPLRSARSFRCTACDREHPAPTSIR